MEENNDNHEITLNSVLATAREIFQTVLKNILLWLLDDEHKIMAAEVQVNEDTDEDEGYGSIASSASKISKSSRRRRQIRQEDLKIVESDTKEVLIEKFLLLRDAYDELKDDTTRLEFEVESLKDAQDDNEKEMRLQKAELLHIKEKLKVLEKENDGNKVIIDRQQQMIDSFASNNISSSTELEIQK